MKDVRLERFLNKINFDITPYPFFNDYEIDKVVINKKQNTMTIYIKMKENMDIKVYEELYEKSKKFESASKVYFVFLVNDNSKKLKDYFNYYFNKLLNTCPMLGCIDLDKIKFENNIIDFEVLNKAEIEKIDSLKPKIINFLKCMGYEVDIISHINEEEHKKLQEEIIVNIEEATPKETKRILKGTFIKGESRTIKNLITAEDNVIITGFVFGVEGKTTASGWNIITLKVRKRFPAAS